MSIFPIMERVGGGRIMNNAGETILQLQSEFRKHMRVCSKAATTAWTAKIVHFEVAVSSCWFLGIGHFFKGIGHFLVESATIFRELEEWATGFRNWPQVHELLIRKRNQPLQNGHF